MHHHVSRNIIWNGVVPDTSANNKPARYRQRAGNMARRELNARPVAEASFEAALQAAQHNKQYNRYWPNGIGRRGLGSNSRHPHWVFDENWPGRPVDIKLERALFLRTLSNQTHVPLDLEFKIAELHMIVTASQDAQLRAASQKALVHMLQKYTPDDLYKLERLYAQAVGTQPCSVERAAYEKAVQRGVQKLKQGIGSVKIGGNATYALIKAAVAQPPGSALRASIEDLFVALLRTVKGVKRRPLNTVLVRVLRNGFDTPGHHNFVDAGSFQWLRTLANTSPRATNLKRLLNQFPPVTNGKAPQFLGSYTELN